MSQEPRFYWDTELEDDELTEFPFGDTTARIIDLEEGGVIAYVHQLSAPAIVASLIAAPPEFKS